MSAYPKTSRGKQWMMGQQKQMLVPLNSKDRRVNYMTDMSVHADMSEYSPTQYRCFFLNKFQK